MNNFIRTITTLLKSRLGDNYTIFADDIIKKNDITLHGIVIGMENEHIAPTIYMEKYFYDYQHGRTLDDIVDEIIAVYNANSDISFDIAFFKDYEKLKGKIFFQIVNTARNREFLKNVPNISYLDFSIIFKILVTPTPTTTTASIVIKDHLLSLWDVTIEDVYKVAISNTPMLFPHSILTMYSVLKELAPGIAFDLPTDSSMYILTNHQKIDGSSCILYPNVLLDFSNRIDSDFYVLPSSTHEVILIPATENCTAKELSLLVHEVNTTQVPPEDFLSNNVYYFSRNTKQLVISNV